MTEEFELLQDLYVATLQSARAGDILPDSILVALNRVCAATGDTMPARTTSEEPVEAYLAREGFADTEDEDQVREDLLAAVAFAPEYWASRTWHEVWESLG